MSSNLRQRKKRNELRTCLLILTNEELRNKMSSNLTQINSRNFQEIANMYSNLNNDFIKLKEENFVSENHHYIFESNVAKEKFILKSPNGDQYPCFANSKLFKTNNANTEANKRKNSFSFQFNNPDENIFSRKRLSENEDNIYLKYLNYFELDKNLIEKIKKKCIISSKKNIHFIEQDMDFLKIKNSQEKKYPIDNYSKE